VLSILEMMQKIMVICNSEVEKNTFYRFLVDSFYNKVLLNKDYSAFQLKTEMQKLINLSKETISETTQQVSYE